MLNTITSGFCLPSISEKKSIMHSIVKNIECNQFSDRKLFLINIAFIISGIAYGFFIRLPLVHIGFSIYGSFFVLMSSRTKSKTTQKNLSEKLESQKKRINELMLENVELKRENAELKRRTECLPS